MIFWFFQSFPLPFPLLKFFSLKYLITFLVSFIWNSQKCTVFQNIWCLVKTQLKNITQTFFQGGSPWATLIHNSVVCLKGTLLCPAAFLRSWFFDFSIISFTFSFAKVFSFNYLITFLVSFIWNSQKCPVSQNIWCLIKTQLKNITQTIFQGGSPWATLIHNTVVCLEGTLLCAAAFLRSWFLIFSIISFTFSFAKVFSFNYLITFLVSFIWNSQKCPVSQNIWCLIKTQLKTSLKQFFKGVVHEQPWYIIVWFVWRVHYCVQLLSWGHDFLIFSIISFTFSFAKVFFF